MVDKVSLVVVRVVCWWFSVAWWWFRVVGGS